MVFKARLNCCILVIFMLLHIDIKATPNIAENDKKKSSWLILVELTKHIPKNSKVEQLPQIGEQPSIHVIQNIKSLKEEYTQFYEKIDSLLSTIDLNTTKRLSNNFELNNRDKLHKIGHSLRGLMYYSSIMLYLGNETQAIKAITLGFKYTQLISQIPSVTCQLLACSMVNILLKQIERVLNYKKTKLTAWSQVIRYLKNVDTEFINNFKSALIRESKLSHLDWINKRIAEYGNSSNNSKSQLIAENYKKLCNETANLIQFPPVSENNERLLELNKLFIIQNKISLVDTSTWQKACSYSIMECKIALIALMLLKYEENNKLPDTINKLVSSELIHFIKYRKNDNGFKLSCDKQIIMFSNSPPIIFRYNFSNFD